MKFDANEQLQLQATAGEGRVDLYATIHKALRAWMTHTLVRVGQLDSSDDGECREVAADLEHLLDTLEGHLMTENTLVHPAIESRHPGAIQGIVDDHALHLASIAQLRFQLAALLRTPAGEREASALFLYRSLAVFVAENLEHMQVEETHNNGLLWAAYSDAELLAIHGAILASIPPEKMAVILRWMIPAVTPATRAQMLAEMRAGMPAEAFTGVLGMAHARLPAREWTKLTLALNLPQAPGLVDLSRH